MRPATLHARRVRLIGVGLVVVSAFGFGSGALFARPAYAAGLDWLTLMWWRFLIAAVISWGWLLATAGNRDALRALSRRRVAVLLLIGLFYVTHTSTFYASLETVPASLAALIVYVYPALVAVLSIRFGRALEGPRAWAALALSTLGVALAVGGVAPGALPPLSGLLLAVASPILYAIWVMFAARLAGERRRPDDARPLGAPAIPPGDAETAPESTSPALAVALMTTATAAGYLVLMVAFGRPIAPGAVPGAAWPGILGIAVFATAISIQTFYAGTRRIGAARASLISTVEPVYTVTLATLLLGESLTPTQVLGGALVICGVVLAELGQPGRPSDAPIDPLGARETA